MGEICVSAAATGGSVEAVASKSAAVRAILCAALCREPTVLGIKGISEDIRAALRVAEALGCSLEESECTVTVRPADRLSVNAVADCGESATVLRLSLPVFAAKGISATLIKRGNLMSRSLFIPVEEYARHGVTVSEQTDCVRLSGRLGGGKFTEEAKMTSQNLSGLLLAAPLIPSLSLKTSPEVSEPYFHLTEQIMSSFGISIGKADGALTAVGEYTSPVRYEAEGDWSSAAYHFVLGAIGKGRVSVSGLDRRSAQGDKKILDLLFKCGARLERDMSSGGFTVYPSRLRPFTFDASDTPDLVPLLALLGSVTLEGKSVITGVSALKYKECDRLLASAELINTLGGRAEVEDGALTVAASRLRGGRVSSYSDHRIVMTAAVASAVCEARVTVDCPEAVNKSYPDFFGDFISLGGEVSDTVLP